MRYLYFGDGGTGDIAYNNGLATIKVLRDGGITVHYWEHQGGHSFVTWKQDLHDFLPFLFQYGLVTATDQKEEVKDIKTYPNPFSEELVIQCPHPFQYKLYAMDGREVEAGDGSEQKYLGRFLLKGSYILKIEMERSSKTVTVLKQ